MVILSNSSEVSDFRHLKSISNLPSFNDVSPGKANSDPLPSSTPTPKVHFAIDVFPPKDCSLNLSSFASPASLCRLTPTIADIGNKSWAIAHEDFFPLESSGLRSSTATAQTAEKVNVSFSIKVEDNSMTP